MHDANDTICVSTLNAAILTNSQIRMGSDTGHVSSVN